MNEARFRALVQDRLIDTDQVRELLGLDSVQGVRHRVEHGWLSGPVIIRKQAISLWDREQVVREEARRLADLEMDRIRRKARAA